MLYKSDIANLALGRLGVSLTISDIEVENSQQAKVIRRYFRMSLDTLLEKHPWGFATQFIPLILASESPTPLYAYSYQRPGDALVIVEIAEEGMFSQTVQYEDQKNRWQEVYALTGPKLYTNVRMAHAKYTTRLPENMQFPNHFGRALAAQLSMDIAPQLITNNFGKVRDTLNANAMIDITHGIADDLGRQPLPEDSLSPFVRARLR